MSCCIFKHICCCCSFTKSCLTLCDPVDYKVYQASLSLTISQRLPKFISIELVMPSNHLILCHPLFLLPSIFPSIRVFPNESAVCIRQPKDWSFSFNISLSKEYSGFISFKIDWFDLLALQGTLKSLLQNTVQKHQLPGFFKVQLSHLYMTTGNIIAVTYLLRK